MPENMLCSSVKQVWHEEFQACTKVPDIVRSSLLFPWKLLESARKF